MLKVLTILITTSFSLSFGDSLLSTKYDVEILRDTWGVPHIYGVTDKDVAFGFAFAHSEDDFKTIQDVVLQTRGELSSIYGKATLPIDYLTNLLRVRENVEQNYDKLISSEVKDIIEAYVDGLNYYSSLNPSEAIDEIGQITANFINSLTWI